MSIKTMSKRNLSQIKSTILKGVVFIRYESGRLQHCDAQEVIDAVTQYESSRVASRSVVGGMVRMTVTMGPSYRYQVFFSEEEARRQLPERLFKDGDKHTVASIAILYGGDTEIFPEGERVSLSSFESRCFTWCMANMSESDHLTVKVTFSNGKQLDLYLTLSMTLPGGVMGLADYINKGMAYIKTPSALERYKNSMDEYFLLSSFNQYYKLS
ncbi:hypothetical protein NTE19_003335 [Vibrio fluvialis]|nr:hypothetical protein [Vibrio fluvialis]